MSETAQNSPRYIRYRDIVLQRVKEYNKKNKGKIKEYARNRYKNLSQEEKINWLRVVEHGLIDKVRKNKMKWEEKQESMQKIDIITI